MVNVFKTTKNVVNSAVEMASMDVVYLWAHGLVNRTPPNIILRRRLLNNTLVQRRTTSLCSGVGGKCTCGSDGGTSLVDKGIFVQRSDGGVTDDGDMVYWSKLVTL